MAQNHIPRESEKLKIKVRDNEDKVHEHHDNFTDDDDDAYGDHLTVSIMMQEPTEESDNDQSGPDSAEDAQPELEEEEGSRPSSPVEDASPPSPVLKCATITVSIAQADPNAVNFDTKYIDDEDVEMFIYESTKDGVEDDEDTAAEDEAGTPEPSPTIDDVVEYKLHPKLPVYPQDAKSSAQPPLAKHQEESTALVSALSNHAGHTFDDDIEMEDC